MYIGEILSKAPFTREVTKGLTPNRPVLDGAGRLRNAWIIVRAFTAHGVPPSITLAALTNAHFESALAEKAANYADNGGVSIGLFQLRDPGAGSGYTVAQRMDPELNTRVILQEYDRRGEPLKRAHAAGATVADLAALFGQHVERGLNLQGRAQRAREQFPAVADMRGLDVDRLVTIGMWSGALIPVGIVTTVVGGIIGLWFWGRYR